jgi:transposase
VDKWEKYRKIRQMHINGYSDREIARTLNVGRGTVKKYRQGAATPNDRVVAQRAAPLREAAEIEIKRMLLENESLPRKQRRSAKDMWDVLLSEHGIAISEAYTRYLVSDIRGTFGETFIPLEHEIGDCFQTDWLENAVVIMDGVKILVQVIVFVLPYSGAVCAFPYPDKVMLSFLHGHAGYFQWLGGIPRRGLYDLLKTAALSGSGARAVAQEAFMRFAWHYAFEPEFCNRAAGWEKSHVENGVKITRSKALTPIPRVKNFKELRDHITAKLLQYNMTHKIQGRPHKIWDMFLEEQASLKPLPLSPFEVDETIETHVYPDQTVRYDKIRYSVPYGYVGKHVTLRVSPFELDIYHRGDCLCTHMRVRSGGQDQYILDHYLEILARKPRAANQALPIKKGIMPAECRAFLKLCPAMDANNQLVEIMLLAREAGKGRVLAALNDANGSGKPTAELVKYYLYGQQMPDDAFMIKHSNLSDYDKLINGEDTDGQL